MQYRHLGKAGVRVSEISFGAWVTFGTQVGEDLAAELMRTAYDAGVNFFDNAESYAGGQAEVIMGKVLKKMDWPRESFLVSTKFFWGIHPGINLKHTLNRKYLLQGIDGSLQRLQLDFVDLIFCHRPDPETPVEETVWTMHDIIEQGKAVYWGTSEWSAAEIVQAYYIAELHHLHKPQMEQMQYNMFVREKLEKEYARLFRDFGYGATIWSPLAGGLLSGKYNEGIPAHSRANLSGYEWIREEVITSERVEKVKQLVPLANELGCTMAQLALAWCLKNQHVSSVITGATRVAQLKENLGASEVAHQLTPEFMERIETILKNKTV